MAQPLDPLSQPEQPRPHLRCATAPQSLRRTHRPASAAAQPRRPARAESGQQPGSAGSDAEWRAAADGQLQGQPAHLQLSQQPGSAAAVAQLWAGAGAQTQGQPLSSPAADAAALMLAGAELPPQMGRPSTAVPQRRSASRPGSAPAARRQKVAALCVHWGPPHSFGALVPMLLPQVQSATSTAAPLDLCTCTSRVTGPANVRTCRACTSRGHWPSQ